MTVCAGVDGRHRIETRNRSAQKRQINHRVCVHFEEPAHHNTDSNGDDSELWATENGAKELRPPVTMRKRDGICRDVLLNARARV